MPAPTSPPAPPTSRRCAATTVHTPTVACGGLLTKVFIAGGSSLFGVDQNGVQSGDLWVCTTCQNVTFAVGALHAAVLSA